MKTLAIVGGLGKIGRSLAHELCGSFERLIIIDPHEYAENERAFFEKSWRNPHSIYYVNAENAAEIAEGLRKYEVDVCIGAVPSSLQHKVTEAAAMHGKCHCFDLGASEESLLRQKELANIFKGNNKLLMPFCGFDPGMLNVLILSCALSESNYDEIKVYVGGIAEKKPENTFVHEWTFNPESTLETYRGDVLVIQDGMLDSTKALNGYVNINIGTQNYEAFFTDCGNKEVMLKVARKQPPRLQTCEIRTIRHIGHWQIARFLLENGFLANDMFPETINKLSVTVPFAEKDIVIAEIRLFKKGQRVRTIEWLEHGDSTTAMQKITAKSAAFIITNTLEGIAKHFFSLNGMIMPEVLINEILHAPPEDVVREMKKIGLSINDINERT